MSYLLDTHVFIWYDSEPAKLSPRVFALCEDKTNTRPFSLGSNHLIRFPCFLLNSLVYPRFLCDTFLIPMR
jgi:hypothetical protein